jgi:penicillin-binding protein 1B
MVGGRSYEESQLNRATDAQRQPGSVFKPFVYAAAFEAGISPLSIYHDGPQTFQYGNATYSPANYGGGYSMNDVLLREGLVRSLNVVTVDLAMRTGLNRVASTAARFGLPRPAAYPSMALGTFEATPLQMAAAYSVFANGGRMVEPTVIAKVVDNNSGEIIDGGSSSSERVGEQVIKPSTAYLITDILSDVTRRGTARRANATFKGVAIAGKTGTSRDGWFVGYTPGLVCAVWVGFDDNEQLGLTGADAALPAWMEFMKEALALRPSLGGSSFAKPSGIVRVKIDPETGELAGPNCPSSQTIDVPVQFAPRVECFKHMREAEPLEDDLSWESSLDVSIDSVRVETNEAQEPLDKTLSAPDPQENRRRKRDAPENPKQSTEIDTRPGGRKELLSAPVVSNARPSPRTAVSPKP